MIHYCEIWQHERCLASAAAPAKLTQPSSDEWKSEKEETKVIWFTSSYSHFSLIFRVVRFRKNPLPFLHVQSVCFQSLSWWLMLIIQQPLCEAAVTGISQFLVHLKMACIQFRCGGREKCWCNTHLRVDSWWLNEVGLPQWCAINLSIRLHPDI